MPRLLFAAFLLTAAAPALAEDWRYVSIDQQGEVMAFVDIDSIGEEGGTRTAWLLHVQRDVDHLDVVARRYQATFDCARRRARVNRIITYDGNDRISDDISGQPDWTEMQPDSQGGGLLDYVCSNGASSPDAPSMGSTPPVTAARRVMQRMGN